MAHASYLEGGELIKQILPGIIYADDIVVCADSRSELQELADICGRFSQAKSRIIVFDDIIREPTTVQGIKLVKVVEYKCLDIWINEGRHYLQKHERHLLAKTNGNAAIVKNKVLWNFNRYEAVRGI